VGRALGVEPLEVIFTSGGTEANDLAIRGAVEAMRRRGDHIVTTALEHPSALEPCRALEREGLRLTVVAPRDGVIHAEDIVAAVDERTILVSVMHVQNETGAVHPVEAIARAVKARSSKVVVHSDGVQGLGKLPPPQAVDLYTISAHKAHGPKGAGALVARRPARVVPRLVGGGQERGLRSGTENLPAIVGMSVAVALAVKERAAFAKEAARLGALLRDGIVALGGVVNSPAGAVASTLNASFPGAAAEPLVHALEERGVYVSTGAACSSRKQERSPTLRAMGLDDDRIASAIRLSLSRETTEAEVVAALAALRDALPAAVRS
jgi:cysteine desulfurase